MGMIIGREIKLILVKVGVIVPDHITKFVLLPLVLLFISLLIIGWIKFYIDRYVLKKCKHGVRYGVTEGICEECISYNVNKQQSTPHNESIKINEIQATLKTIPGICRCCTLPVKIRYQHQNIPDGTILKYNVNEIEGWKEEYKKVCHLSNYAPRKYYLDLCDECYKEMAIGFVKEVKYGSWLDSIGASLVAFFWIVLIISLFDLIIITPDSIFWCITCFVAVTLYFRYVYHKEVTTPSSKAVKALDMLNHESEDIIRTLALIERMDREEELARERIRVRTSSGIYEIDKMSGIQFEQRLASHFSREGYVVQKTSASGDHGADLILEMGQKRIAIQAKRYGNQSVGNKAIQEVISGRIMYDCDEGWVITTSFFTRSAEELANKANVKLIDRNDLIEMLANSMERSS